MNERKINLARFNNLNMIKVGITGQDGFLGWHIYNNLKLANTEFECINFSRSFFNDEGKLDTFVNSCDVIVHLAAMNRHESLEVIYETNINLTKQLIDSLKRTGSKAHVLFSSSTQEESDNLYGKSKMICRELFLAWANEFNGQFSALIIPNVFGPFGKPNYNSFISTFSYKVVRGEQPTILNDNVVRLIFVQELVDFVIKVIKDKVFSDYLIVPYSAEVKVSEVLSLLIEFKKLYIENGIIPKLENKFKLDLFNTFRSYINLEEHFPVHYLEHRDSRGAFVEIIRLNDGGQISFSTTYSGITRGNHFHTRKIERFSVIKGKALIQLRKIDSSEVLSFELSGDSPAFVDMPIWYTHNIKNIGGEDLYTIFWINEFYNPEDADTYFEEVETIKYI